VAAILNTKLFFCLSRYLIKNIATVVAMADRVWLTHTCDVIHVGYYACAYASLSLSHTAT
jgi:hypothetical protein